MNSANDEPNASAESVMAAGTRESFIAGLYQVNLYGAPSGESAAGTRAGLGRRTGRAGSRHKLKPARPGAGLEWNRRQGPRAAQRRESSTGAPARSGEHRCGDDRQRR
jgi:hypothetical protein